MAARSKNKLRSLQTYLASCQTLLKGGSDSRPDRSELSLPEEFTTWTKGGIIYIVEPDGDAVASNQKDPP
jgi:hypothetical protein